MAISYFGSIAYFGSRLFEKQMIGTLGELQLGNPKNHRDFCRTQLLHVVQHEAP